MEREQVFAGWVKILTSSSILTTLNSSGMVLGLSPECLLDCLGPTLVALGSSLCFLVLSFLTRWPAGSSHVEALCEHTSLAVRGAEMKVRKALPWFRKATFFLCRAHAAPMKSCLTLALLGIFSQLHAQARNLEWHTQARKLEHAL